jgi:hypothetical protein
VLFASFSPSAFSLDPSAFFMALFLTCVPPVRAGERQSVSFSRTLSNPFTNRTKAPFLPPAQLAASILKKEQRIAEIMGKIQKLLAKQA